MEIENSILSCVIAYPEQSLPYVTTHVKTEDFVGNNQDIYQTILALYADGRSVDFLSIVSDLKAKDKLEGVGGASRFNDLMAMGTVPSALKSHVKLLKEQTARRKTGQILRIALSEVENGDIGETLARTMLDLENVAQGRMTKVVPTTKELVMTAVKRIQDRADGKDGALGITTGIKTLDDATGGLRPASQWLLAGPAKGGKSSLALCFLQSLSVKHKKRCDFYWLEMPSIENVERMICLEGNVSAKHLRDGMISEHDMGRIMAGATNMVSAPIHFRDDVFDLAELVGNIRQRKAAFPDLYAVFVDYAQLLTAKSDDHNREREVAVISRTLRQISMKLDLCVVLLSQVNDDGRLRESRSLGMDATKIIYIELRDEPGVRGLRLVQRDGPACTIEVAYVGDKFRFADLTEERNS
jgi:replicative DNA helicase